MLLKYIHKGEAGKVYSMVNSRRMMLIGIIIICVVSLGIVATLLTGAGSDQAKKTCDTFLTAVMNKEVDRSYSMMSPSARESDSAQSWSEKVVSLEYIYKGGTLNFNQKTDLRDTNDPEAMENEVNTYELSYTLVHPAATSDIQCRVINTDGKHYVDGFSSTEKPAEESENQ